MGTQMVSSTFDVWTLWELDRKMTTVCLKLAKTLSPCLVELRTGCKIGPWSSPQLKIQLYSERKWSTSHIKNYFGVKMGAIDLTPM